MRKFLKRRNLLIIYHRTKLCLFKVSVCYKYSTYRYMTCEWIQKLSTFIFSWWGERISNYHYKRANVGKKQRIRLIYTQQVFRYLIQILNLLSWNNSIGNKLFEIEPVIRQSQPVIRNVRQEAVLRIGQTRITHSYLLKREEQPHCFGCNAPFIVRLLECGHFVHIRNKYFRVDRIKQWLNDLSTMSFDS